MHDECLFLFISNAINKIWNKEEKREIKRASNQTLNKSNFYDS